MGNYTSDIKKYYEKLGDSSDEKVVKDYTSELADQAEDDKKSSKFTYPTPEKPKQTREKHKGAF